MLQSSAIVFFPALMAFAACSDLFTMTISNRVSLLLAAGFLIFAAALGLPWQTILAHVGAGAGILVLTFAMFSFGWIGGGDAKLAAATALWIGYDNLLEYGLYASLLGGALTFVLVVVRRWPLPATLMRAPWITRLHDEKSGIPYGIALAAAGALVFPQTQIWLSAAGA